VRLFVSIATGGGEIPVVDVMTTQLISVGPGDTAAEAIRRMVAATVGSAVVLEGSLLVGIFTERDVLRLAAEGTSFESTRVGDVMTPSPKTIGPDDDILDASRVMAELRVRHVPVAVAGQVLGVVGIRDVVRVLLERAFRGQDGTAHATARDLLGGSTPVSSPAEGA
jgi:CBS domain-containing protein